MAETTKSPVFSSPAYWIALGVGVVGIGAAAMQERKGSGSMAHAQLPAGWTFTEHDGDIFVYKQGRLFAKKTDDRWVGMLSPEWKLPPSTVLRAITKMRKGSGSMARSSNHRHLDPEYKLTQKRLDADKAMFNRRFGGLVTEENGDSIQLSANDYDDLQHYLDNHTLWTHVEGGEGESGGTYLLPGLHHANHIDYYISVRPWMDSDLNTVEIAWTK